MQGKMQRFFFRFILLLTLLSVFTATLSSQDANTSRELYNLFIGKGYQTDYQGLCPSQSEIYPRNIIISIPRQPPLSDNKEHSLHKLSTVFLTFPQENIAEQRNEFIDFTDKLAKSSLPLTVKILLAANEGIMRIPSSEGEYEHPTGIPVFAASLDSGENCCAIVCKNGFRNQISSGGGGAVAPIWLVKSLKEACEETDLSVWLPNSASFLYRLGFINEDSSISPFMDESIPAIGLYLRNDETPYETLLLALQKLSNATTDSRDYHYSFVSLLSLEFWLDETFFLLCYIVTAIAVLLRICFSTIGHSDRNRAIIKDLGKSWYLILVMLAFTAGILQLSQKIPGINSPFAVVTLGQRLVIVIAASLLFFILLSKLKIFISFESISRIMLFIAACNIFIFCALDISFLFLFIFEYITCAFARRAKGKISIAITLILMFIPFIPHAVNILLSSNPWSLTRISNPGPAGNLITALILFPFQLQFLRLLMQMEFFAHRKKSFILFRMLSAIIFVGVSVVLFAFFYFLFIRTLIYASFPQRQEADQPPPTWTRQKFSEVQDEDYIRASYSTDSFMEYKFTTMVITVPEEIHVYRYEICLETENGIPLNDCNYGYTLSGRHKAYLAIPDNPSSDLDIVFTCEKDVAPVAIITSYLQDKEGNLLIEHDNLSMLSSLEKE